jgi:hypothetical protein
MHGGKVRHAPKLPLLGQTYFCPKCSVVPLLYVLDLAGEEQKLIRKGPHPQLLFTDLPEPREAIGL